MNRDVSSSGGNYGLALSDLGEGREFGDVATRGHAERAVQSMLTEHPSLALEAAAGVGR